MIYRGSILLWIANQAYLWFRSLPILCLSRKHEYKAAHDYNVHLPCVTNSLPKWHNILHITMHRKYHLFWYATNHHNHYSDVIMSTMTSQISSLTIVYLSFYSNTDQRKHQSSASLAFVWGIHRSPVNSPHKWPVTRKMFPFNDVIITNIFYLAEGHGKVIASCIFLCGMYFTHPCANFYSNLANLSLKWWYRGVINYIHANVWQFCCPLTRLSLLDE